MTVFGVFIICVAVYYIIEMWCKAYVKGKGGEWD